MPSSMSIEKLDFSSDFSYLLLILYLYVEDIKITNIINKSFAG